MPRAGSDRRLIGEILVDQELVTQEQLREALRRQQEIGRGEYLGEILVRLGYAEDIDIVTALGLQCNLPFIAISKQAISTEVLRNIPAEVARRNRIIPLNRSGNILSVVMQDPLQDDARDELERFTGCHIAAFISTRAEIELALARFYPL
ncbi:MAG: hypothetical protein HGA80_08035 [Candidatus Omnitrophica bacterium]|nr:hypothetical protein [Candidatus Omnitrophota bacterium]